MTKRSRKALLLLVAVIMALALPAATVVAQESGTIIAEGFNGPQGVLVDPDGNVWVIDSGVGGDTEFDSTDPTSGDVITGTYGQTARVVEIAPDGTQTDVATLPSIFAGDEATGGARLAMVDGELYATSGVWIGNGTDNPAPTIPNTAEIVKIGEDGSVKTVAATWRLEKRMNPDNAAYESHPYGLAAGADGKLWVADAGANTLLRVDPASPVVELVTTFPAIPGVFPNPARGGEMLTDPVPTGIAFDDDGNAYVSLLSGAPFVPGSASVVKVTPLGARSDYATGLTMLTDITRGPDGEFYAVQFAVFTDQGPTPNSGAIIKIGEGDTSTPVVEGLSFPTSIDFDSDGNAYITINGSGAPGTGAVVKYDGVGNGETYLAAAAATAEPSEEATAAPTEEATQEPTEEATQEATEEPTQEPTEEPTQEPTEEPTQEATATAQATATSRPTATATAPATATSRPTATATKQATATSEPTVEPTQEPTEEPTEEPTAVIAEAATATTAPTEEPTEEPTAEATLVPTEEPTQEATVAPTEEPTQEPTAEPTEEATQEPTAEAAWAESPTVLADDQVSDGTQVTVAKVVAAQDGWMVIHSDADGKPGPVLGQTAVAKGTTENVVVMLDQPVTPDTPLWAMLHVDEGVQGVYEFPGPDVPAEVNGAIVMVPFTALAEPTAVPTVAPTEEATAVPTEEAAVEATVAPTEEATAAPAEEATVAPTEEVAQEATAVPAEEAAPAGLPNTGAALPSLPSVIAVVVAAFGALVGGISIRRRK
jgi:sugar lactone lactonase YvrE